MQVKSDRDYVLLASIAVLVTAIAAMWLAIFSNVWATNPANLPRATFDERFGKW